jgi:ubiquinone biosynthesis protein UbiJ
MATSPTPTAEAATADALEQSRREKLARMADRFDEVDRRLDELEARLEQAEEEFRPKQPR